MNKTFITALILTVVLLPAVIAQASPAQSSQTLDVQINNFPETQKIRGSVSIEGTASHATSNRKEGILVPPSRRNELSELTFAGTVDTDGFTSISVNLLGEVKSGSFSSGQVGVLLLPDEKPVLQAFRESRRVSFPLEAIAKLKSGDLPFFDSERSLLRIEFPRYKIFLYNTTNQSVEANVYLYLSN